MLSHQTGNPYGNSQRNWRQDLPHMSFISVHLFNSVFSTGNNLFCVQLKWALRIILLTKQRPLLGRCEFGLFCKRHKAAEEYHCQVRECSQHCVLPPKWGRKAENPSSNVPKTKSENPLLEHSDCLLCIHHLSPHSQLQLPRPAFSCTICNFSIGNFSPCFSKHKSFKVHDLDTKLCRIYKQTTLPSNQVYFFLQLRKGETVILYF